MKISKVILYDEPTVPEINLGNLKNFLQQTFPVEVEIRENILKQASQEIAKRIAECKVFNLRKDFEKHEPTTSQFTPTNLAILIYAYTYEASDSNPALDNKTTAFSFKILLFRFCFTGKRDYITNAM